MWVKAKGDGCRHKMSLFFLILNIVIAFGLGVISAYMSSNGCSRVFPAVAVISFLYLVLNFVLILWDKAWSKVFSYVNLFLIFTVLLITVVGLGFSVYQSTCDVIACYQGAASIIDSFYRDFHSGEKSSLEDQQCDLASDKVTGQYVSIKISNYLGNGYDSRNNFYIIKGWPIGFLVLQLILSLMHMIKIFLNLFTCQDCKPQARDGAYIYYF
ncbi:transmembrane protein, putative (macronuclear) [Tetrahymena thermophila SB210]|uniref:Transmembrane protein, putative n=1 Tax=Tetrahymena thermophila (strain SB210) TaxID=312017 RepID=Q224D4_TETTS|nr:transmembrane protein, putative [Tetrahymena thermophila SB210]EAR80650.2 transmembrane protein, putative [Tetrahymena thermophila SB210]|eukprot:XP_001028313.2 transmembrane protein, putative [Tetrahymena thermophila SB210]